MIGQKAALVSSFFDAFERNMSRGLGLPWSDVSGQQTTREAFRIGVH